MSRYLLILSLLAGTFLSFLISPEWTPEADNAINYVLDFIVSMDGWINAVAIFDMISFTLFVIFGLFLFSIMRWVIGD